MCACKVGLRITQIGSRGSGICNGSVEIRLPSPLIS